MPGKEEAERLLRVLAHLHQGTCRVRIGETTVMELDTRRRVLKLELGRIDGTGKGKVPVLHEKRIGFWQAWGFARELDASGWQVILERNGRELVWMGRGVSALTGHIRADIAGLARAGELERLF